MGARVVRVVRIVVTAAIGVVLCFFVAVSTFADGPWEERRVLIGALLLGYGFAGVALGIRASAWYGLGLAGPGVAALVFIALGGDEGSRWYLLYGALALALAVGGAYLGATRWPAMRPHQRTAA